MSEPRIDILNGAGTCHPGCPCPARVIIGKGLGWETGWAAHRERWTRLIAIHRWLGAAHHVEKEPLYGEDMVGFHMHVPSQLCRFVAITTTADVVTGLRLLEGPGAGEDGGAKQWAVLVRRLTSQICQFCRDLPLM